MTDSEKMQGTTARSSRLDARLSLASTPQGGADFQVLETLAFVGHAPVAARLEVRDGAGRVYASRAVVGDFAVEVLAGGALGAQNAVLVPASAGVATGSANATHTSGTSVAGASSATRAPADSTSAGPANAVSFSVDARSGIRSNAGLYQAMWDDFEARIRATRGETTVEDGSRMTYYVPWIRDDVHVMKAAKYWEPEIGSLAGHFLDIQQPDGMIFDYFMRNTGCPERKEAFGPRYYFEPANVPLRYDRLPVEADVEYLLVEGIYTRWQATGDDAWAAAVLPRLEKAVAYCMTDPLRWSPEFGLVKRGYTIDTWDFKFFGFDRKHLRNELEIQDAVFGIDEQTPMCIMHGDNSGMYQACAQIAAMYGAIGNAAKRAEYEALAAQFRANTDQHCWNGRFYDHWVPVTPLDMDQGGIDGCKVLSLSNPYDINRGLPEHDKAAAIVREYMGLRERLKGEYFAEWVSVYPYWPKGFSGIPPATYVNGGVIVIVAGELAKAAFHHGFEAYGVDILDRVGALLLVEENNSGGMDDCAYTPSGAASGGIPGGWARAAVASAMAEGLAGIRDASSRYRHALVEPRWAASAASDATAVMRYGASDGYVAYRYRHDAARRTITLDATGSGDRFDFHVLLPAGASATQVEHGGEGVAFTNDSVETSSYADFRVEGPLGGSIVIAYSA